MGHHSYTALKILGVQVEILFRPDLQNTYNSNVLIQFKLILLFLEGNCFDCFRAKWNITPLKNMNTKMQKTQ